MTTTAVSPSYCPLCGQSNECGAVSGSDTCWCMSVSIAKTVIDRVPADARGVACICAKCASAEAEADT